MPAPPAPKLPFPVSGRPTRDDLPRRPDQSVLYGAVRSQLETFVERQRWRDRPLPRFVERELRGFLDCGILANGFLRVHCGSCGKDRLVAFSCKGRGFCSSCGGRRMADTAAHLVDRVLPVVPVRQWVLSLPVALRYRLAYDAPLVAEVLRVFVRTVFGSLRRRAWNLHGTRQAQGGAVTFVQRFGGALNLNVHFHTLAVDGVYAMDSGNEARFHVLPPPGNDEVVRVTRRVSRGIARLLERRGLGPHVDPLDADPLSEDEPLLASLYGASVRGRIATGPRAGRRVMRLGDRVDAEDIPTLHGRRCADVSGLSVHADVCVPARDRQRLERLCRYAARPPVATERLERLEDGRLLYRLRRRWRDGTTHVLFEPLELIEKLAALVPPPRFNLVRYHGVFAPAARWRAHVVPNGVRPATTDPADAPESLKGPMKGITTQVPGREGDLQSSGRCPPRPRNYSWAELMRRVFEIDVLECPRCAARPMRILSAIHPPETTAVILECLGLPTRSPPLIPAPPEDDPRSSAFDSL